MDSHSRAPRSVFRTRSFARLFLGVCSIKWRYEWAECLSAGTQLRVWGLLEGVEFHKERRPQMLLRLSVISAAVLVAGSLTAAAQQQLPQEPRGEESSQSATPRGQLPGPNGTTGQRAPGMTGPGTAGAGKTGPGGQSTPQEPRGEEGSQSATPRGQQPGPTPSQPR